MSQLAVSVIIPTYNRAHLIRRAINSALQQLRPGDEIIVADDESTDNTEEVVRAIEGPIKFMRVPHGGAGSTRNHAVKAATKPLVAFLDSDDEWMPDKLQLQRTYMECNPDVLFSFTDFRSKCDSGEETPRFLKYWHKDTRSWDEILGPRTLYSSITALPSGRDDFAVHKGSMFLAEMESNYIATTTVVVRRIDAGSAIKFSEDLSIAEDKECFALLAQAGTAAYLDCETSYQWGHGGPRVTDTNLFASASATLTLLDRIWAKDEAFAAKHRDRIQKIRSQEHLKRARWLLVRGRNSEAKSDLEAAGSAPLSFRLLASMPPALSSTVLKLRRVVSGRA